MIILVKFRVAMPAIDFGVRMSLVDFPLRPDYNERGQAIQPVW